MGIPAFYNNTSIPYGSRVETFTRGGTISSGPGSFTGGTSNGAYVCENIMINRKSKVIKRSDEIGGPNGSVGVPDFDEASLTVQLATAASKQLERGDAFTDTFDTALGAESYVLTEVDQPEAQNDYKKQSVKAIRLY